MSEIKSTDFLAQTAEDWLARNVYTVPLRSRSKRPKGKDWPHLRLVEEDFKNGAFKQGDNIGALWGEASDHATDIDLDLEEAVEVAEHILPETFTYGRTGKEWSHYLYRIVGADEAREMRLVSRVVPHAELLPAALELAQAIAANPPLAVQRLKAGLREALDPDWSQLGSWVSASLGELFRTEDHKEGVAAFLEKREARYVGR